MATDLGVQVVLEGSNHHRIVHQKCLEKRVEVVVWLQHGMVDQIVNVSVPQIQDSVEAIIAPILVWLFVKDLVQQRISERNIVSMSPSTEQSEGATEVAA